uniref:Putative ovule protein n=1 Tax=Solanum chacoense TaxID=4108 RepID=A0A0V0HB09_SOLCH
MHGSQFLSSSRFLSLLYRFSYTKYNFRSYPLILLRVLLQFSDMGQKGTVVSKGEEEPYQGSYSSLFCKNRFT